MCVQSIVQHIWKVSGVEKWRRTAASHQQVDLGLGTVHIVVVWTIIPCKSPTTLSNEQVQ